MGHGVVGLLGSWVCWGRGFVGVVGSWVCWGRDFVGLVVSWSWGHRVAGVTFDVPVDDHVAVEVEDALEDLPGVPPGHVLCQSTIRLQLVLDGALRGRRQRLSDRRTRALRGRRQRLSDRSPDRRQLLFPLPLMAYLLVLGHYSSSLTEDMYLLVLGCYSPSH